MNTPATLDLNVEKRIRESFARQGLINTLNGEIAHISPGELHIEAPFDERFTQQDGFLHAGTITTLMDSACGYAAYTLMPEGSRVLSVEFKVNLLSPAVGEKFRAEGHVVKSGKTISVCEGKLFALQGEGEKLVAMMQATMICVRAEIEEEIRDGGN
jgi:uncharacterized protein (TIGR00369 family)